ncbi:MAG: dihydrodipicolinate synthase family protein [Rhizobiales bacterium]|nr:dihydrodipicolinate synthase family protein [Hyphomicrobiales bacterium]MBO6698015.1 dihydrodipicolinate synthase family protein [Hyphomicrobiales bacterium]MBO6735731.1 dihydrodipicolinate synthase family protein [Hyphomicrobiales bacterium]MBO6910461.1 dihydrodipicolinate synthase family protein [Hyphomicrobiales bacterium]
MTTLNLPTSTGNLEPVKLVAGPQLTRSPQGWNRIAYAAAHVVADPLADNDPWLEAAIDWDRTLAFRDHLWSLGFGVAEAMDTAQRGMGLNWAQSLELIQRSVAAAKSGGHLIACGAGTDHLTPSPKVTIDDVIAAYEMQCDAVEATGGRVILMASRALAKVAKSPDDYARVYTRVLGGLQQPAILHWLGEVFDPALEGYWGSKDHWQAMDTCLDVIAANAAKTDGIKISLLSAEKEVAMRRRLPDGVNMYTGDDFNYPDLIAGDDKGFSHALLGIFDPIAGAAAQALGALSTDDQAAYHAVFDPTVPLSRHIFKAPTRFYKTGVVFMAYLNGHQDHFTMIGGQESTRSTIHLADIIRLANNAKLFTDPERTVARARPVFAARGVEI